MSQETWALCICCSASSSDDCRDTSWKIIRLFGTSRLHGLLRLLPRSRNFTVADILLAKLQNFWCSSFAQTSAELSALHLRQYIQAYTNLYLSQIYSDVDSL